MAPVIHACVEDTEILAMECAVPDVYQGHVIDIVELFFNGCIPNWAGKYCDSM